MEFILKRVLFYGLAFVVAITLNFFLPRIMPGDPVQAAISKLYQSGGQVTEQTIEAVKELYGFNEERNLFVSYINYLKNIIAGDWGLSLSKHPLSVQDVLRRPVRWTLFLMGSTLVLAFIINNLLGILVAWRRGSSMDIGLTVSGQVLANIPPIIIAMSVSYILAYRLNLFPTGNAVTPLYLAPNIFAKGLNIMYHASLPILTILISTLGGIMGMRANMINQLQEDYITMAKAKGCSENQVMFQYGARNALLPVFTSLAMSIGFMLGGSLIVEQIFNYPGLGLTMVEALNQRDYPLLQGILLLSTTIMLVANFIADVGIYFLDPRLRQQ